jgi:hypothetical protein
VIGACSLLGMYPLDTVILYPWPIGNRVSRDRCWDNGNSFTVSLNLYLYLYLYIGAHAQRMLCTGVAKRPPVTGQKTSKNYPFCANDCQLVPGLR